MKKRINHLTPQNNDSQHQITQAYYPKDHSSESQAKTLKHKHHSGARSDRELTQIFNKPSSDSYTTTIKKNANNLFYHPMKDKFFCDETSEPKIEKDSSPRRVSKERQWEAESTVSSNRSPIHRRMCPRESERCPKRRKGEGIKKYPVGVAVTAMAGW